MKRTLSRVGKTWYCCACPYLAIKGYARDVSCPYAHTTMTALKTVSKSNSCSSICAPCLIYFSAYSGPPNINFELGNIWRGPLTGPRIYIDIVEGLHCNYLFTYLLFAYLFVCLFINELFNIWNLECGSDTES